MKLEARDRILMTGWYLFLGAVSAFLIFSLYKVYATFRNLDWGIFLVNRGEYARMIVSGLWMTLKISFFSMLLAMLLGTLVGVGRLSRRWMVRALVDPYVEFFRNTPLLIQIFFWYFGTHYLLGFFISFFGFFSHLFPLTLHVVDPGQFNYMQQLVYDLREWYNTGESEFISGVAGLSIFTSAFIAEIVRAGIQSLPRGQWEAARSTGLSGAQTLVNVILPQAFRIIIPPLITQFLNLTKNSSMCMVVGVAEMTYQARLVESYTFRGFEAFTAATLIYLVLSLIISLAMNMYERYISIEGKITRAEKRRMLELEGQGAYEGLG